MSKFSGIDYSVLSKVHTTCSDFLTWQPCHFPVMGFCFVVFFNKFASCSIPLFQFFYCGWPGFAVEKGGQQLLREANQSEGESVVGWKCEGKKNNFYFWQLYQFEIHMKNRLTGLYTSEQIKREGFSQMIGNVPH